MKGGAVTYVVQLAWLFLKLAPFFTDYFSDILSQRWKKNMCLWFSGSLFQNHLLHSGG